MQVAQVRVIAVGPSVEARHQVGLQAGRVGIEHLADVGGVRDSPMVYSGVGNSGIQQRIVLLRPASCHKGRLLQADRTALYSCSYARSSSWRKEQFKQSAALVKLIVLDALTDQPHRGDISQRWCHTTGSMRSGTGIVQPQVVPIQPMQLPNSR